MYNCSYSYFRYSVSMVLLCAPDQINRDKDNSDRKVIYKSLVLPHPWGDCYVRVVIKYRKNIFKKGGWVCSAMASYHIKSGEAIIWEK